MSSRDVVAVPCLGCNRQLRMPKGAYESQVRRQDRAIAFCTDKCQRSYIAREADKQRAKNIAGEKDEQQ